MTVNPSRWSFLVVLAVAACSDGSGGPPDAGVDPVVERGRYLVNSMGLCGFCHTPILPDGTRDQTRLFAGMVPFADIDPTTPGFGQINSRNLTNHETGLKNKTDLEIKDAFLNGHRTDGMGNLVPIMPYWVFHNMAPSDADAIVAYLRTLTPVDNLVPPNEAPWSFLAMAPPQAYIDPNSVPMPGGLELIDMNSALRGRYLASTVAICIDCHSPEAAPMSTDIDRTRLFAGGRPFPKEALYGMAPGFPPVIFTANITPHTTGIGGWTHQDIRNVFRKGHDKNHTCLCAPTHGGPTSPYAGMDDRDLDDISNYIRHIPGVDNPKPLECEAPGFCQL